jgi:hypothetical protein
LYLNGIEILIGVECSDRRRRMLWQEETHSEHL